jgi:hypothetical protein
MARVTDPVCSVAERVPIQSGLDVGVPVDELEAFLEAPYEARHAGKHVPKHGSCLRASISATSIRNRLGDLNSKHQIKAAKLANFQVLGSIGAQQALHMRSKGAQRQYAGVNCRFTCLTRPLS